MSRNILVPTRNERRAFKSLITLIKRLIYIATNICGETYKMIKYIEKIRTNFHRLNKIGYNLDEILNKIDSFTPRQFEVFTAELFQQYGYTTKITPPSNDYGRDVILKRKFNGKEEVTFVECKHYGKNDYVGREICQKLLGSVQMFGADNAVIITTGKFHKNAYEVASMCDNLQLMDLYDIQKMILDLKPEQISKVMIRTYNVA